MARTLYGGSPADVIAKLSSDGDYEPATAAMEAYDSLSGGAHLTSLQDKDGAAVSNVTPDAFGRVVFYGPDGYTGPIWLEGADGVRWRIDPADLASRATGGGVTVTNLDSVPDSSTRLAMTTAERSKLSGVATGATKNDTADTQFAGVPLVVQQASNGTWPARPTSDPNRRVLWFGYPGSNVDPTVVGSGTGGMLARDIHFKAPAS